jgi:hypothetical protein
MKKERVKFGVYLPKEIYAELYRRQLPEHFSFLVACLLEEFLKRTDVSISREEMPTRAEQREYLERKVRELFSRAGQSTEPSKPPVQERKETSYVKEPPKKTYTPPAPQPAKEEKTPSTREDLELDEEVLRRIESLW